MVTNQHFINELKHRGWVHFKSVLNDEFVHQLNNGLDSAYSICRDLQVRNGVAQNTNGTVHHLLGQHPVFLSLIENMILHDFISDYFGAPYILNGYGGVINLPDNGSYVCNIHRDIRTFYNIPMMLNMLIMLDDFTLENGATWFLSGSNNKDEKPDKEYFYENADRAIGKAGDVILFDSLLWHAAGINKTEKVRRALTLTFTRPFMKQQLDYPRLLGFYEGSRFSPEVRQVLGYNSRVPSSLDEWYQPADSRFYMPDQG